MKLLIVQKNSRFSKIKSEISFQDLGFSCCVEISSSEAVLQKILEFNPHLVVLDMDLPGLSGREIIKSASARNFQGKFLIFSDHFDLATLQPLISYHVSACLPSKYTKRDVVSALSYLRKEIRKEKEHDCLFIKYNNYIKTALFQKLFSRQLDAASLDKEELGLIEDQYQVIIYEKFEDAEHSDIYHFSDLFQGGHDDIGNFEVICHNENYVVLLKGSRTIQRFKKFLDHYHSIQKGSPLDSLFISYGRIVNSIDEIHLSYEDAKNLMERRFFCTPEQHTLGYSFLIESMKAPIEYNFTVKEEYCSQLKEAVLSCNWNQVEELLFDIKNALYHSSSKPLEVKLMLLHLYLSYKQTLSPGTQIPDDSISVSDFEILRTILLEARYLYQIFNYLHNLLQQDMKSIDNSVSREIMNDITNYIDRNYQDNIKLEHIAELFGYNSSYLGKLIRKKVGISFNSYLDQVRIHHAKVLLTESTMKIYEISEKLGYNNVDYFQKKFKKYVGQSPSEFRKCSIHP